jgi:homoserine O-acetyltransferase
MELKEYKYNLEFPLEAGGVLPEITIGYHTYGTLNKDKSNVVWVCHALTADSNPLDWWAGLFGDDCVFNPKEHFIVCANFLGSCYGTTGPHSIDRRTNEPYYSDFPLITIRDMVKAHDLLRQYLEIDKISVCIGGSGGGHQVLEYGLMFPNVVQRMITLASSATESAWRKAIHTTQRMSIEADSSWEDKRSDAAEKGLKAARGIGLLTYRTIDAYVKTQSDDDDSLLDNYKASSYIRYQGEKLGNRFNAYSYWILTKALDTHNVGRNRAELSEVLNGVHQETLIISIDSDILMPKAEQEFLANHIPNSSLKVIESDYGHDGFLIETEKISKCVEEFLG